MFIGETTYKKLSIENLIKEIQPMVLKKCKF